MQRRLVLGLVCMLAACSSSAAAPPADEACEHGPLEPPVTIDGRDQYVLLDAIVGALAVDDDEQAIAFDQIQREWHGKRYRWEGAFVPLLCRSAASCVVAPFDHTKTLPEARQGWMPRLELDPAGFAALRDACLEHERCIVSFEATLSRFQLAADVPTSLAFSKVRIIGARAAGPGESWIRSRPKARTAAKG